MRYRCVLLCFLKNKDGIYHIPFGGLKRPPSLTAGRQAIRPFGAVLQVWRSVYFLSHCFTSQNGRKIDAPERRKISNRDVHHMCHEGFGFVPTGMTKHFWKGHVYPHLEETTPS